MAREALESHIREIEGTTVLFRRYPSKAYGSSWEAWTMNPKTGAIGGPISMALFDVPAGRAATARGFKFRDAKTLAEAIRAARREIRGIKGMGRS